jgi:hypothetical protein
MSIRTRTTKLIARRHDLNYFKKLSPVRAWQWYLAIAALVCAVLWFSASTIASGNNSFSAGPMSSSHAVFGEKCELCHVPVIAATGFTPSFGHRKHVPDSACLSCHTAPPHHPMESKFTPTCSSCHTEHIGSTHLANTSDQTCTQCHARLETKSGALRVAANVGSFAHEHPDFRPFRTATEQEKAATLALRFTHATHMQPGLRNAVGGTQNLQCQYCHNPIINAEGRQGFTMAPVSFEKSCRSCHSLDFDTHIQKEAPHARVAEVKAFVEQEITSFAQQHPDVVAGEIRNWPSETILPGQTRMAAPHSTSEWIANRTLRAETILWREKCELCHKDLNRSGDAAPKFEPTMHTASMEMPPTGGSMSRMASLIGGESKPQPQPLLITASMPMAVTLPNIEPSYQPSRWFKAAVFSHPAHQAVECAECHTKALASNSGADVLMPSIATCRRCHDGMSSPQGPPVKAGHAESGCYLCHVYHGPEPSALAASHNLPQLLGH